MPVFCLKTGRMWPNKPESCVDVVEATTIDLSCASEGGPSAADSASASRKRRFIPAPHQILSDHEVAAQKRGGFRCLRRVEEVIGRGSLDQAATRQKDYIAGKPPRLSELMRRH